MESRFRKLVSQRREKNGSHTHELVTHTIPYQSASSQAPQPIFIYQSLGRNTREACKLEEQDSLLKGLSYDSVVPGKAPMFVGKPQKGNGPIKLQTSRRLSSGELLATSQDNRRTLADIREGDYVIGRKIGHASHSKSPKAVTTASGENTPSARYTITGRPSSPRPNGTTSQNSWLSPRSLLAVRHSSDTGNITVQSAGTNRGLGISAPVAPKIKNDPYEIRNDSPTYFDSNAPAELPMGPNATISALWKAEYSRLVKLYGQDGVDRNMAHLDHQHRMRRPSHSSIQTNSKPPSIVLEPLPQPSYERKSTESKRSSATSGRSSSYRDDNSDASSFNRASMASSCVASSSYTTQTSFGEVDAPTTREDIRKIVQEMRSTYLRALEAQPPTPNKPRSTKKKRRQKAPKMAVANTHIETKPSDGGRKTWHGDDIPVGIHDEKAKKPRATSHPVDGFGGFPVVEDTTVAGVSAPRPELQRADSLTLGGLVGDFVPKRKTESASRPTSRSKQDDIPHTPQKLHAENLVSVKSAEYKDGSKTLVILTEMPPPEAKNAMMSTLSARPFSSAAFLSPKEGQIPLSRDGTRTRPPPMPTSQMSLVNVI